ncbi:hypothetical protein BDI4_520002 [Burkholderia diffusa]|nr:hypothetical protein BDI4_520002 [Burkholderia diffusa]
MLGARLLRGSAVPLARLRRPLGQGSGLPDRRAVGDAAVTTRHAGLLVAHAPPNGRRVVFGAAGHPTPDVRM